MSPDLGDIIVWNNETCGHLTVISEVHENYILVAQQNIHGGATERFTLANKDGRFTITSSKNPNGWLRLQ